jgi:hypothetical protein
MLSNCFVWAHWRERLLWREWEALGCPVDRVPCIQRRPSRSSPTWTRHWVVGWWHYPTATLIDVESFVPDTPRIVPWYLAWTRVLFSGHVKRGDNPSLPPN